MRVLVGFLVFNSIHYKKVTRVRNDQNRLIVDTLAIMNPLHTIISIGMKNTGRDKNINKYLYD